MTEPVVHVVDDDRSFVRALARLLTANGFEVQAFGSGNELLAAISADSRGCVVVDLDMPGLDGLQVQEALAARRIRLPVVFLSGRGDIPSSVHAMRQGAVDFLEKRAPAEILLAAIRRAIDSDDAHSGLRERFARLSAREREILGHVVRGRIDRKSVV